MKAEYKPNHQLKTWFLFQVTYIFLPNRKMQPINNGIVEGESMPSQTTIHKSCTKYFEMPIGKSCGNQSLYIWSKIKHRRVYSLGVKWILRQWRDMSAIYVTKIWKWKQERLVATRYLKFCPWFLSTSSVCVTVWQSVIKDSFEFLIMSTFQNCPWYSHLTKNWLRKSS